MSFSILARRTPQRNCPLCRPYTPDPGIEARHLALQGLGLIPGIGNAADALDAILYFIEGDSNNALLSAAAMIPALGQVATSGRLAGKGVAVIGSHPGYLRLAEDLGLEHFSIDKDIWDSLPKDLQLGFNAAWLDNVIAEGKTFSLRQA